MKRLIAALVVLLAILTLPAVGARAEWVENFDSYATGSQLHGQGGWKGWDNIPAATGVTSSAWSLTSPNSAEIGGSANLVHEYSVAGDRWLYSAMQYIPSSSTNGTNYFILLNDYNDGGPYDWSVQLYFDLATGQVTSSLPQYGTMGTASIVRDQWVELLFDINLDANTVDEYYNGSLLASHPWDDGGKNTLDAVDLYGGSGASPIFYDNMQLTTPEPSTLGLLCLGAAGLFACARRGRRRAA